MNILKEQEALDLKLFEKTLTDDKNPEQKPQGFLEEYFKTIFSDCVPVLLSKN